MNASARILIALIGGVVLGAVLRATEIPQLLPVISVVEPIGTLWLNALRMSVIPLIFALVVTGVAATINRLSTGALTARTLGLMIALLLCSAAMAPLVVPTLLAWWPPSAAGAEALRAAITNTAEIPAVPSAAAWLRDVVPINPIKAAADGAMLSLLVFALAFGFAMTRIEASARASLVGFFQAVVDTLLVIVHWVLWLGPLGVFALAFTLGARTGIYAAGGLLHYMAIMIVVMLLLILLIYLLAVLVVPVAPLRLIRALGPAQVVAVSSQSSLASLPAMVEGCQTQLGISQQITGLVLPLAVTVFRVSGPAVNLGVALYSAHIYGVEPGAFQIASAVVIAVVTSMASLSLPGQISFYASTAPLCLVLGVPLNLLPLMIAVETIPDIFRTVANVTGDVAVTAFVDRRFGKGS